MKIYVVMCWDEHEGLFNQHEPIGYFLKEEDAQELLDDTLSKWIEEGLIKDNNVWYEQHDPEVNEPDDDYLYIDTIEVQE